MSDSRVDWRIRITEAAHKAGFQPDSVSGALICTPAVIENFARAIERQALERAKERCESRAARARPDNSIGYGVWIGAHHCAVEIDEMIRALMQPAHTKEGS